MTFAEAMARAAAQLDDAIRQSLERSRQSYVDGGISPDIFEPLLDQHRAELVAWRDARLDELRRFIRYGDVEMPTMAKH